MSVKTSLVIYRCPLIYSVRLWLEIKVWTHSCSTQSQMTMRRTRVEAFSITQT